MDERLEELFPFYALGALSDEERARVDDYVARDAAARARLDEVLRAAASVPLSAAPIAPAPYVKTALMNRVNADAARLSSAAKRAALASSERRSRFDLAALMNRSFFRIVLPVVTAISLLTAILIGVWAVSLNAELNRLRQETALLQQQLSAQRTALLQIASPHLQAMSIGGTPFQPQAQGQMLADPRSNKAILVVSDLQPLSADRTYQFWLIRNQVPVSGGVFTVDQQGRAILSITLADAIGSFDSMGVSIEPSGGSAKPTGDIVMLSPLSPS